MALAQRKRYTYDDYRELPDYPRMELIEGELLLSPVCNTSHQGISVVLISELYQWVKSHALGAVFPAPCDVVLSEHNVVQPDILFISKERSHIVQMQVRGAPDFAIEILSPGNRARDLLVKKALYEKFGVREYWIVDPKSQTISVFLLEGKKFRDPVIFSRGAKIESAVVRGFKLSVSEVFRAVKK